MLAYFYDFVLCLWGKPLYELKNIEYIIILHVLAIVNFLLLSYGFFSYTIRSKAELFFLLHGCLMSVLPYNGYLISGIILMTAGLVSSAIRNRT